MIVYTSLLARRDTPFRRQKGGNIPLGSSKRMVYMLERGGSGQQHSRARSLEQFIPGVTPYLILRFKTPESPATF